MSSPALPVERRILAFAVLFAGFILLPGFAKAPFPPFPLMQWADAIDLATPIAVGLAYWRLFKLDDRQPPSRWEETLFVALLLLWASQQGIHLTANSVTNLFPKPDPANAAYVLANFFDERLSHGLWALAIAALSALLVRRQLRFPLPATGSLASLLAAASLHGFSLFCFSIEGRVTALLAPYAIALCAWIGGAHRMELRRFPVAAFFLASNLIFLALVMVWAAIWMGLPELSAVEWI